MILVEKFHKILMCLILSVFLVAGMVSSASALPLVPGGWSGTSPTNPGAGDVAAAVGYGETLGLLYKAEVEGAEEGSFAASYHTTFLDTPTDPSGAVISHVGGPAITGFDKLFLLVKDGVAHDPIWYIFDISVWDGMESILLSGFWPDEGAISHVDIFGGGGAAPVPEPATVLLLGVGLAGLVGLGRKKILKK